MFKSLFLIDKKVRTLGRGRIAKHELEHHTVFNICEKDERLLNCDGGAWESTCQKLKEGVEEKSEI